MPNNFNNVPFGPSASVSDMLLVNGGEMSGKIVIALIIILNNFGRFVLFTTSAKT